jgi:hypothetical protein
MFRATMLVTFAALAATPAAAQSLAARVAAAPADATVSFRFEARDELCGDGERFIGRRDRTSVMYSTGRWSRDEDWRSSCLDGPARVTIERDGRSATRVRAFVGGAGRARAGEIELGDVAASEAAAFLLGDVAHAERTRAARDALFAATLAADVEVWPDLLRIARDETLHVDVRKTSTFWLGQAAGDRIANELGTLARDDDQDLAVRRQALFALSQRPAGEGVPLLIEIARSDRHPELRRQALFWLGQSQDPRALRLFEEILLGRR